MRRCSPKQILTTLKVAPVSLLRPPRTASCSLRRVAVGIRPAIDDVAN